MASAQLTVRLLMQAGQYKSEARQAATATQGIGREAANTTTATGKLQNQMGALATTAKFAVAGAATAAVVKFGKDSVQAFLGFDDAMNQSLAIMGDVSDTMRKDMSDAAREIGKTTRISAEEAAEAYFFLASAGLDAEQSIAALPQVARFAQAGMFDMATATDLATDAQSALGLTVDDAQQNLRNLTRVTDVFSKANNLANTSVQQVAEAMTNKAGAAMRAVGIDIEEGTAVLAAFADQGVKGAEAGTQFSIVLRDLQTRALANASAFEAAGISVFDSQGEFRNFADIIGDLERRLGGMSDAQKKAELSTLGFTDKSISALTTLLGTSDAIREYETELRKAGGTTKEVADKQLESFQGQLEILKGRIKDVQITLGEALVPVLIEAADAFLPFIELIGGAVSALGKLGDVLGGAGAGIGLFVDVVINSIPGMRFLRDSVGFLTGLFEENTDVVLTTAEAHEVLALQMEAEQDELLALKKGTRDTTAAQEDAEDAALALARAHEEEAEATRLAALQQRTLIDAYKEAADPIFAAHRAVDRYRDAQDNLRQVQEDGESTARDIADAELAVAAAALEAEGALRTLGRGDINAGIHAIAEALGVSDDKARDLLVTLGLLDGKKVTTIIETRLVTRGGVQERQHGGPVSANQAYLVGERGPELFVPHQSGTVLPNSTTGTMGTTSSSVAGGTTINIATVYGYDDFVRKVRDASVDIRRLGI